MENKIAIRLVDNVNPDIIYTCLDVDQYKIHEIQQEIYIIKLRFDDQNDEWYNPEWQVADVLDKLYEKYQDICEIPFDCDNYLEV